jgi:hypothetical protein
VAVTPLPQISPRALNGLLAGDDQAGAFVAAADEHEHEVGGLVVEGDVSVLVDDRVAWRPADGLWALVEQQVVARFTGRVATWWSMISTGTGLPERKWRRASVAGLTSKLR